MLREWINITTLSNFLKGPVQYYCIGSALEAKPLGLTPNMYIYLESGDQGGSDSPGFRSLKIFFKNDLIMGKAIFQSCWQGGGLKSTNFFGGFGIYI